MIFVSRKVLQNCLFLGVACTAACNDSSNTVAENSSIVGQWFHGCLELDTISFPKTAANLGGIFSTYELEFTENSFETTLHLYQDNNCRDWNYDITIAGTYRILNAPVQRM